MGWIKQKKNEHICPKPDLYDGESSGDIWECGCKALWVVREDPRDGDLYWAVGQQELT